jgi:hypothetical protein
MLPDNLQHPSTTGESVNASHGAMIVALLMVSTLVFLINNLRRFDRGPDPPWCDRRRPVDLEFDQELFPALSGRLHHTHDSTEWRSGDCLRCIDMFLLAKHWIHTTFYVPRPEREQRLRETASGYVDSMHYADYNGGVTWLGYMATRGVSLPTIRYLIETHHASLDLERTLLGLDFEIRQDYERANHRRNRRFRGWAYAVFWNRVEVRRFLRSLRQFSSLYREWTTEYLSARLPAPLTRLVLDYTGHTVVNAPSRWKQLCLRLRLFFVRACLPRVSRAIPLPWTGQCRTHTEQQITPIETRVH